MIQAFDYTILTFYHELALITHNFFLDVCLFLDFLGRGLAIPLIMIPVVLLVFKKTRRIGLLVGLSMLIGFIVTNLLLKNVVNRPRPFNYEPYKLWYNYVKNVTVSDSSFPSGHSTSAAAIGVSLCLYFKDKKRYLWLLFPLFMGMSRNYLMVHYPSDVVAGLLIGTISAWISYHTISHIYPIIDT